MNDFISLIRQSIGHQKLIHPGARIIVENDNNEFLIVQRSDNGKFGIPAGSLEENETIEECILREVYEETGIRVKTLDVIGISTNPELETVTYSNGDVVQYFTIEFYSNNWEGTISVKDQDEIRNARFVTADLIESLPKNEKSAFESLHYFRKENRVMMK